MDIEIKTLEDLRNSGDYQFDHNASKRGYIRIDDIGKATPYNGRLGIGYIVCLGRHNNSTRYCSIAYWIKKAK